MTPRRLPEVPRWRLSSKLSAMQGSRQAPPFSNRRVASAWTIQTLL